MPDSEKVMGWLEGLAEPDWRECYSDSEVQETARQALDLIDELLKEQEAIVRCKDCKWRYEDDGMSLCGYHSGWFPAEPDWFCAASERKD